jgi:biotin operon repressor
MELKIPVEGSKRIYLMLNMLSTIKPFNSLNNREKQVLAELLYINHELRKLDENKRNRLIFDFDTRRELSQKLNISHDSVYNLMSTLRKKGLLIKDGFVKKYVIPYTEELKISFSDDKGDRST